MKIIPQDIVSFCFCPYLHTSNKRTDFFGYTPTFLEKNIIKAIKQAEESCIYKGSEIDPQKIARKWDLFWWPTIAKKNFSLKKADDLSIKASSIFSDYCKYDISNYMHPTVGADIQIQKNIYKDTILHTTIDILKVDLNSSKKNCLIVGFGNKPYTTKELVLDLKIQSTVYSFFTDQEHIIYTYIYLNENLDHLNVTSVIFRKEDMYSIEKTIKYLVTGMKHKINYMNKYNCEVCKQCRTFKF